DRLHPRHLHLLGRDARRRERVAGRGAVSREGGVRPLGPGAIVGTVACGVEHDQLPVLDAHVVRDDGQQRLHDARGLAEADGEEDDLPVGGRPAVGVERLDSRRGGEAEREMVGSHDVAAVLVQSAVVAPAIGSGAEVVEGDEPVKVVGENDWGNDDRENEEQSTHATMSPAMAMHIAKPTVIEAAGNKPKLIEEFVGRVNSGTADASVARMRSPGGWVEPGQTPEFDEYTVVLRGALRVTTKRGVLDVRPGEAVIAPRGEWVQY